MALAAGLYTLGIALSALAIYARSLPGNPAAYGRWVGYLSRVAWIVLLVVFAREAAPLGRRVTSYLCVLLAALEVYGVTNGIVRVVQPFAIGVPFRLEFNFVLGLVVLPVLGILNSVVLFVFFVMAARRRQLLPVAE